MKAGILRIGGCLFLALGGIGVLLPVFPTTPFVLLAAGCFCGSSPNLYRRLASSRVFGPYVRNYREKTGISRKTKGWSLLFLWGMLLLSALLTRSLPVGLVLLLVGGAVTAHILLIRTKRS